MRILARRRNLDNLRNPLVYWVRLLMFIALAVAVSTMFYDIGHASDKILDRAGVLVFASGFLVFLSIVVVPAFIEDRAIFERERANGYYHVISHVLVDCVMSIPGLLLISLVVSAVIFWLVGLSHGFAGFLTFIAALFVSMYVAESMVAVVATLVSEYVIGMALAAGIYGLYFLCQGFLIIESNMPVYWRYSFHYVSFLTYSFRIFMLNEFKGEDWGVDLLKLYGFTDASMTNDFIVLIANAVIYRLLYFLILYYLRSGRS
eukprot:m.290085 g.290085  ORF g.290085 m.290085 type:complete len:261 (+) comp55068_c0_seq2:897-1679(+)